LRCLKRFRAIHRYLKDLFEVSHLLTDKSRRKNLVEAAGVEPASLKPSAQIYYKLSRCCLFAWHVTDKRPTRGRRHFIYTRLLTLPSFFARCRRPISLTSIRSRTGQNLCCQLESFLFNVTKLSENLVSFSYRRSHLHVNIAIGIYMLMGV